MFTTPLPSYPWERVAADLFELKCSTYLSTGSRLLLQICGSAEANNHYFFQYCDTTEGHFARFGIPATLTTDNGAQFDSHHMNEFDHAYEFQHTTTSLYYPQANVLAERMVKTVKKLLEHSADPYTGTWQHHCPGVDIAQLSW